VLATVHVTQNVKLEQQQPVLTHTCSGQLLAIRVQFDVWYSTKNTAWQLNLFHTVACMEGRCWQNFYIAVVCSGNVEVSLICMCPTAQRSQCWECAAIDTLCVCQLILESCKGHKWVGNTIIGRSKKCTEVIKSKRNRKKKENTYENGVWTCNTVCVTSLNWPH